MLAHAGGIPGGSGWRFEPKLDVHRLSARMLHAAPRVAVTLFVFDVLAVEGLPVTALPDSERRALLEELDLESERVRLVATFEGRGGAVRRRL